MRPTIYQGRYVCGNIVGENSFSELSEKSASSHVAWGKSAATRSLSGSPGVGLASVIDATGVGRAPFVALDLSASCNVRGL